MKVDSDVIIMMIRRTKRCVRMDGVTYFLRRGVLVCCASKREHCSGKNWKRTPGRMKQVDKFTGMRHASTHAVNVYEGLPVWRLGAELYAKDGLTSDNYREQVNRRYSEKNGNVKDFRHYVMSVGPLAMPEVMRARRAGRMVTLEWEDEREEGCARQGDVLHVMVVSEGRPGMLKRVEGLAARRSDGRVTFEVSLKWGEKVHVYPFFGREDNMAFSPNDHFLVDGSADGGGNDGEARRVDMAGTSGGRGKEGRVEARGGGGMEGREKPAGRLPRGNFSAFRDGNRRGTTRPG